MFNVSAQAEIILLEMLSSAVCDCHANQVPKIQSPEVPGDDMPVCLQFTIGIYCTNLRNPKLCVGHFEFYFRKILR